MRHKRLKSGIFLMLGIGLASLQAQTVTDIEGNVYKTVNIGEHVWMAENLKTTKFNNGSTITLVTDNEAWSELSPPGYCWYNNDQSTYGNTYGALYNCIAVYTGALCPTGWHVPTDAEWTELIDYLGGTTVAGDKLKETGTTHWNSPNTGATNKTGFTAIPGGGRNSLDGTFSGIGFYCLWWSSSEDEDELGIAFSREMSSDYSGINRRGKDTSNGFYVRCTRD